MAFFSNEEFTSIIEKYNNLSVLSPNRILWKYLKAVVKNTEYLNNIVNIGNIHVLCINPVYWLLHFKLSSLVIIPKPKKAFYDSSKIFCSIILLNMLKKLIKKIIDEKLQFQLILKFFIYLNQLREFKQHLSMDTGHFITFLIWSK